MKKVVLSELFDYSFFLLIIYKIVVGRFSQGSVKLEAIGYALFFIIGVIGLLTVSKRNPSWRIFDVIFNALWTLYGVLMLYSLYIE